MLKRRLFRATLLTPAIAILVMLVLTAAPVGAVGCNTAGCWNGIVDFVRIGVDGKIWFVVEGSANLNNLVPADGCQLRSLWTGQADPALYIRADDPDGDEKYAMLLTAFTTGSLVGFAPVKDPATGWCSLGYLYLR